MVQLIADNFRKKTAQRDPTDGPCPTSTPRKRKRFKQPDDTPVESKSKANKAQHDIHDVQHYELPEGRGGTFLQFQGWRVRKMKERGHVFYQIQDLNGRSCGMLIASHFPDIDHDMLRRMLTFMLRQAVGGSDKGTIYKIRDAFKDMHMAGTLDQLCQCADF